MELIFTMSVWSSTVASCSIPWTATLLPLLLLYTTLKWFFFLQFLYIFLHVEHSLWGWPEPQYPHCLFICPGVLATGFAFFVLFPWLYSIEISVSLKLSNIAVCDLWASPHLDHGVTCPLITILVSFNAVSLCRISVSMSLPFRPWINCFFNCLSTSLQLYFITAIPSLPIHSSAFSPLCLLNLQDWKNLKVLVYCEQNLLLKTSKKKKNLRCIAFFMLCLHENLYEF